MPLVLVLVVGAALGLVLGLLGGGGGILAVPLLVHVLGQGLDDATTTSLVVVAIGAAAGLVPHARAGRVDWRAGLAFGVLGSLGAVVGARGALWADDRLQAAGFVALLVVAGVSMLRGPAASVGPETSGSDDALEPDPGRHFGTSPASATPTQPAADGSVATLVRPTVPRRRVSPARLVVAATAVGLITGFFGVGGGFVAVPALVFGLRMPVRRATATGLVVIVVNSAVALAARGPAHLDVPLAAWLGLATAAAAVAGALLSARVPSARLRRSFGAMILVVAAYEAVVLAPGLIPGG